MESVTIRLDGAPVAWARARVNKYGARFNTPKVESQEQSIRVLAMQAMAGRPPYDCPVVIEVRAYMAIPPSWSGKKKQAAANGAIFPTGTPDLSNLVKLVEDGMNTVVYCDDSRIVQIRAIKKYSTHPCTVVQVIPVSANAEQLIDA